uniref:Uncharacterized protein n=1 Tax=Oncorhynchus tshawytscha TaxID=74940 RepID=A0A8C8LUT9_ONCTS
MLSLNNLRIMCTPQALQHSHTLFVNRQCVSKASSFYAKLYNNSITFTSSKDTRHNNGIDFRSQNESKVKHVNSLERTFCTASVKLNFIVSDFLLLFQLELKIMHIEEGTDNGANPMFLMELMEITKLWMRHRAKKKRTRLKLKDLTEQIDPSLHKGMLPSDTKVLCLSPSYSLFSLMVLIQMLSDVLVSHMVQLSFRFCTTHSFFLFNRRASSCQNTSRPNEIHCEH